ncbi:MAG: oligosaccharide flippase family protein, partial [Rhodospirillales bacterium]
MMDRGAGLERAVTDGRIKRGAALLLGGNILQAIVGFSAQIVLLRHLLPEDVGRFVLVLASASLIQSLISLRVNVLAIRARQEDLDNGLEERYRCCIAWEMIFSTGLTILWLWIAGLLNIWAGVLLLALSISHWADHNRSFYERKMPYGQIAYIETGSQLFGHGSAIVLILLGTGAAALYLRELLTVLVRTIGFSIVGALPLIRLRFLSRDEWKSLVREAAPVWLNNPTPRTPNKPETVMIISRLNMPSPNPS